MLGSPILGNYHIFNLRIHVPRFLIFLGGFKVWDFMIGMASVPTTSSSAHGRWPLSATCVLMSFCFGVSKTMGWPVGILRISSFDNVKVTSVP